MQGQLKAQQLQAEKTLAKARKKHKKTLSEKTAANTKLTNTRQQLAHAQATTIKSHKRHNAQKLFGIVVLLAIISIV